MRIARVSRVQKVQIIRVRAMEKIKRVHAGPRGLRAVASLFLSYDVGNLAEIASRPIVGCLCPADISKSFLAILSILRNSNVKPRESSQTSASPALSATKWQNYRWR